MTLTLGFLYSGIKIFEHLHCRQEFWHKAFKSLTNKQLEKQFHLLRVCRKPLFSSAKSVSLKPFRLSLDLGAGL